MKSEPILSISALIGGLMVYLGYLLFLVMLHLSAILTESARASSVLVTVFIVFLSVYVAMLIFGLVAVVIHVLRWLTYKVTTPKWKQENE